VLTASPAAFAARSIYVNPLDGLNLNRPVPRRPARFTKPAPRPLADQHRDRRSQTRFVDMHCGDMNEALVSFTGIEETGDC
jgi:predicted deacylase